MKTHPSQSQPFSKKFPNPLSLSPELVDFIKKQYTFRSLIGGNSFNLCFANIASCSSAKTQNFVFDIGFDTLYFIFILYLIFYNLNFYIHIIFDILISTVFCIIFYIGYFMFQIYILHFDFYFMFYILYLIFSVFFIHNSYFISYILYLINM